MTLRLILMRHAKSSWDNPLQSDHDRPLNPRGQASARALGDWLAGKGLIPDLVLCSTATRTRETLALLNLPKGIETRFLQHLYHAPARRMLDLLRREAGGDAPAPCVLMVAHNPGCAEFAEHLVSRPPAHPRFPDYPTAATLVADLPAQTWDEASFFTGDVVDFITPRELIG
ncbi:SixA phosphatase family protein [Rhodalgimonas zhirmunskyi]|uniref:Histidine phosphatase family protein n=1 Tax=Rhodalgimonas zhirmunskyi TaxID=2964767 RepID=A0AAJ1UGZ7_9RHOB|nr:histidine phosphatase family protein [Rhodoalgimonas zhirmunskyi]MDQ2095732.1 histidine phosphatase family protein [Rhodoalgimonas zhirmunskyi]